jgi:glycine cleavage system H protein
MAPDASGAIPVSKKPVIVMANTDPILLYDVANRIWPKERDDGNVGIGMTTVATAMAGQLVAFTPKKVGRAAPAGKSCATVKRWRWATV